MVTRFQGTDVRACVIGNGTLQGNYPVSSQRYVYDVGVVRMRMHTSHHDRASDGEDGNRRTVMGRGCIIDRQCGTAIVQCYSFCLLENELRSCTLSLVLRCCTMILLHLVLSSANVLPVSYVYVSCVPSPPAIKYSHNGLCMYVCLEANKMNIRDKQNGLIEVAD